MAHLHEVMDIATNFVLDEKLEITAASQIVPLKRGDHKSQLHTFTMPRYFEGHDMSLCNKVEVHYNNIQVDTSTRSTKTNKSFDEVQNFGILEEDENKIGFDWLVQGDATELNGTLSFCIYFACMNGDICEYRKFSGTFVGVPVGESIYNTEEVARVYADVLAAWKLELEEKISNAGKVKTVNGQEPDENGNIKIDGGVEVTAQVGQLIVVKAVDENGKPTEWEAVDRTHYEDDVTETVFEYSIGVGSLNEYAYDDGTFFYQSREFKLTKSLVEGNTYIVKLNGEEYRLIAYKKEPATSIFLGNDTIGGSPESKDTGEPFFIVNPANGTSLYIKVPAQERLNLYIGECGVDFKQLEEKFIPDTIARVENLKSSIFDLIITQTTASEFESTEFDFEKLYNKVSNNEPVLIWLNVWDDSNKVMPQIALAVQASVNGAGDKQIHVYGFDYVYCVKDNDIYLSEM